MTSNSQTLTLWVLLLQVASTWFMTGVIYFVQIVHYPLFSEIGPGEFHNYEQSHVNRTTIVVLPMMFLELTTALALLHYRPPGIASYWFWLGLILLAVIWLSTFLLQVPMHNQLSQGFSHKAHNFLVVSNWLRTIAWSARAVLVLCFLQMVVTSK